MGCAGSSQFDYLDSSYQEEVELRKFELEEMKCYKKVFSSVINRFGANSGLLDATKTESILNEDYSENFTRLAQSYLKYIKGKKYYNGSKIKNLVYLTCPDCAFKVNDKNTHDKLGYFLYQVKKNLADELIKPISKQSIDLDNFVSDIFDISCFSRFYSFWQIILHIFLIVQIIL